MSNLRPNSDYELLCSAIKEEDKATTRYLILNNTSVNIPSIKSDTPLHWAVIKFEDLEIMTMLLDRGANIHAKNRDNHDPLKVAIRHNKTDAALLLIRRGALVGGNFHSSLLIAISKNNDTIVKMLIDHGMQNNLQIDLKPSLNVAISWRRLKIIEHLLPHCRFSKPSDKYIPKHFLMNPEYQDCLELLLKWNFTVNPDSNYDRDFVYAAVEKGYLPIVLPLLERGIDVNLTNLHTGLNLLKVACLKKHYKVAENLLKHNVSVNVTTPTNTDILNNLLTNYHKYLYSRAFDTKTLQHITCLHIAVLNADPKMTNLLLSFGAMIIDDPGFFNITKIAVQISCEEIVRLFLNLGVNVNESDSEGKFLLHHCVNSYSSGEHSKYNIAKLLLDQGAIIHIQTPRNSLVFEAIIHDNYTMAQLFLDYNADVQYICPDGNSLLHEAIRHYFNVEFIKSLLELHLPVNAVNNKMHTPLLVACKPYFENPLENIEALLDYNANVNCADNELMTPLHYACRARNLEVATVLLKRGANPNAINNKRQTPLHLACEQNYISLSSSLPFKSDDNTFSTLIQLLLQHNANIEAVDEKGWTPLFIACYSSNDKAVTCLLDHHANSDHTDLEKLTPMYIAAHNCRVHLKVIKILLERKVNVHCIDKYGNSIIHILVEDHVSKIIKDLTRTQINFNSVNKAGDTPLHIAVKRGYTDMIEHLIKYGANVNILNKNKRTVLQSVMKHITDLQNKLRNPFLRFRGRRGNKDLVDALSTMYTYKEVIDILKEQVIKLNIAGLTVNNEDLKIIYDFDDNESFSDEEFSDEEMFYEVEAYKIGILELEVKCKQEIERMKTESIGVNNISFYNLLTRNIHFLSRFVKNKKIRQALDLEVYDEKFPLYMDIVRSRFRDAKFRYRMMDSAKKYFILNVTQRLPNDCIDTVFSYLNIRDLKMFIRAMKPLDG